MQMAEDLLRNCDLTAASIDAAAVAAGPGSFTGVRIGVAAAKGFCWARQLPCCGVSTLEAMAFGAACAGGILVPVMDARRSQVYTAVFEAQGDWPRRRMEDCAISLEELGRRLESLKNRNFWLETVHSCAIIPWAARPPDCVWRRNICVCSALPASLWRRLQGWSGGKRLTRPPWFRPTCG